MTGKIKSVSELHKVKPAQQKAAKQQAMSFAEETIRDIFKYNLLPHTPQDIKIALVKHGKAALLDEKGEFAWYINLASLVIMMDIILQNRAFEFYYDDPLDFDDKPRHFKKKKRYPIIIDDQSFDNVHSLIKYCISMVADEYYIENNKIYPQRNQRTIAAVKKLNNEDLNEILQNVSVSSDYKVHLASLSKFLEKHRRELEGKIGQKQVDAFFQFVNTANIRHGKGEQRNPTQAELEIFFDFGLSLARMVL
jgi:hypothetical protein